MIEDVARWREDDLADQEALHNCEEYLDNCPECGPYCVVCDPTHWVEESEDAF